MYACMYVCMYVCLQCMCMFMYTDTHPLPSRVKVHVSRNGQISFHSLNWSLGHLTKWTRRRPSDDIGSFMKWPVARSNQSIPAVT